MPSIAASADSTFPVRRGCDANESGGLTAEHSRHSTCVEWTARPLPSSRLALQLEGLDEPNGRVLHKQTHAVCDPKQSQADFGFGHLVDDDADLSSRHDLPSSRGSCGMTPNTGSPNEDECSSLQTSAAASTPTVAKRAMSAFRRKWKDLEESVVRSRGP